MTTIYINPEAAAANNPAGNWNTFSGATTTGTKVASLIDSAGVATGISLTLGTAMGGETSAAGWTTAEHHGWPQEVWDTCWFSNTNGEPLLLAGFNAGQTGTIKLAGFNPGQPGRDTNFHVNGGANSLYDNLSAEPPTAPVEIAFTADASGNVTFGANLVSSFWYFTGAEINYTAAAPGPSITDVDTDNDVTAGQTGVIVAGTAFEASQGTGTVTLTSPSGLTTIDQVEASWSDTGPTFAVNNVDGDSAIPYGAGVVLTLITDGGLSDTHTITLSPPEGTTVVDVVSPDTTSASLFQDASPAVAEPDQVWWQLVSGENVVVNANGTMTSDSDAAVITFRFWDATDETISAEYTATLQDGVVSVGGGRKQFRISFGMGF